MSKINIQNKSARIRKNNSKNTKKKHKLNHFKAIFFCGLIFIAITGSSSDYPKIYLVKEGEIEDSFSTYGYVFKDQSLICSPQNQKIKFCAKEGEIVPNHKCVAILYPDKKNFEIGEEIDDIKNKIKVINDKKKNKTHALLDKNLINVKIYKECQKLNTSNYFNNFCEISNTKNSIKNELLDFKKETSELNFDGTSENELQKLEQKKLELSSKCNFIKIHSMRSGIFTKFLDGYEKFLTKNCEFRKITPEYLENLDVFVGQSHKDEVSKIGKIIDIRNWYYAFSLPEFNSNLVNVGDNIKVSFPDSQTNYSGMVTYKSENFNGKYVIAVSFDSNIGSLYKTSKTSAIIRKNRVSGMKIPIAAIIESNNSSEVGVYVKKNKVFKWKPIEIISKNDQYAIIKSANTNGIRIYDEIVINPRRF